jgi:hypothetical protein
MMTPERRDELESALLRGRMQTDAKVWAGRMHKTLPGDEDGTTDVAVKEARRDKRRLRGTMRAIESADSIGRL